MSDVAATPVIPPTPQPIKASTPPDWNRTGVDYRRALPLPPVRGPVVDGHAHLFTERHAAVWFETAARFGITRFITQTPLDEAIALARNWPGRCHFVVTPKWVDFDDAMLDDWLRKIESYYNLGSRVGKFHMAPGTMAMRRWSLDDRRIRRLMDELVSRRMAIMTHVGDPDTWYHGKYAKEPEKFGSRERHYELWEQALQAYPGHPWLGAHLGGNPEDFGRLQRLLDAYPRLWLDLSATRWMVREISARRDAAREFVIRNQDRLFWGSDQVSGDDRGFDFLASRWWAHRKLWETANVMPANIRDPDLPDDQQPTIRGLALPDDVLQKLYCDNAIRFLASVGGGFV